MSANCCPELINSFLIYLYLSIFSKILKGVEHFSLYSDPKKFKFSLLLSFDVSDEPNPLVRLPFFKEPVGVITGAAVEIKVDLFMDISSCLERILAVIGLL